MSLVSLPGCDDRSLQRRSLAIISPASTGDDSEGQDTLDYSLFSIKPRLAGKAILRSSPVSSSVCDITEAVNTSAQFQQRFRARSSSISASPSSTSSAMPLSNYVMPVDIKSTKKRTKSFSPGSGYPPSVLLGKYRLSEKSFRSRSSSVSTSSNSSVSSSSAPIPTESTEEFWNQYRRKTSSSFLGKLLKRALSTRQGQCRGERYIPVAAEGGLEESQSSENEDLYDEMYDELYQDVFHDQATKHGKKRQTYTGRKVGMIL